MRKNGNPEYHITLGKLCGKLQLSIYSRTKWGPIVVHLSCTPIVCNCYDASSCNCMVDYQQGAINHLWLNLRNPGSINLLFLELISLLIPKLAFTTLIIQPIILSMSTYQKHVYIFLLLFPPLLQLFSYLFYNNIAIWCCNLLKAFMVLRLVTLFMSKYIINHWFKLKFWI